MKTVQNILTSLYRTFLTINAKKKIKSKFRIRLKEHSLVVITVRNTSIQIIHQHNTYEKHSRITYTYLARLQTEHRKKKQVAFVTMHRYDASTKRNIQRRKCKHAEINTSADLLQIIKVQKHFCELQR